MFSCSRSSDLQWNNAEHYRWAEVEPGYFGNPGFEQLSPSQTNIYFKNQITVEEIDENQHYLNGSGVAAGDIDGDGRVDLYFAGLGGPNRLYKNLDGMQFKDITDEAGVAHRGYYSTGAVFADVNGDTHLDLLVASMHKKNALYMNDGSGRFTLKEDSGLGPAKGSTSLALADIDGDRDLDLYIVNYKEYTVEDRYTTEELAWNNIFKEPYDKQHQTGPYTLIPPFDQHYRIYMTQDNKFGGVFEIGEEDELYINQGGTFEKVKDTREVFLNEEGEPFGLQPDWGLTAKFQDLNSDGLPDLYVCNDFFSPDRVWMNQGNGTFKAIKWQAIRNVSLASMGVDFSDINRDGLLDIFVTEMLSPVHSRRLRSSSLTDPASIRIGQIKTHRQYNRNSLYLKRKDGTYAEISYLSGVEATGWSWDATFMDINLDGYEDLLVNTGYLHNVLDIDAQMEMLHRGRNIDEHFVELMLKSPSLNLSNKILMNNGDFTFSDKSPEWGFTEPDVSHGMATADLDNDGDLDMISNRLQQTAVVYENLSTAPRIAVRLIGKAPNTQAIGAKIELRGGPVIQNKELASGGDYASGSDPMAMFAANPTNPDHQLIVTWPNGQEIRISNVQANRMYEISQSVGDIVHQVSEETNPEVAPLFKDISNRIMHYHHEDPFPDFVIQPFLPIRLSQLGPGIAWIDYNRDGGDDLIIASGTGGELALFENEDEGYFESVILDHLTEKTAGDQTAIIGWSENNYTRIVVGSANYEQGIPIVPSAFIYKVYPSGSIETDSIPGIFSTTGPVAAADYDGDGDLDLFIGGRLNPGKYPENASSRLFKNENGSFHLDRTNSLKLRNIGLVTGAVLSDYDLDGDPDLLISREWDSIIMFENKDGIFQDISSEVGLSSYKGWWNGIATGDFNNDGLPDIVATNLGLNSQYQLTNGRPLRMYFDDLKNNGHINIIEAYADEDGDYLPRRPLDEFQSQQIILNRMGNHRVFANSTLSEIFGDRLLRIPYKEINTLEHMIFINTGGGFEAHALPLEAQFTIAFHAGVADFDNDGNEDLFLSQNFFAVPKEVPRLDASRGLILIGNGEGDFTVLNGNESGIKVYGEQRGAAIGDFNRDGKADLAITQNGAETRLFLNKADKTGYRISLHGPSENRNGIGSSIRLVYENGEKGPRREIQAGSGYWSQNSATQVMGASAEVKSIKVMWFDGVRQTVDFFPDKKMYDISYPKMSQGIN